MSHRLKNIPFTKLIILSFVLSFIFFIFVNSGFLYWLIGNTGTFSDVYVFVYTIFLFPIIAMINSLFSIFIFKIEKKIQLFFLSFLISIFSSGIIFSINYLFQEYQTNEIIKTGDRYCEADSDCVPLLWQCGNCSDYTLSVNKDFEQEYIEKYENRCQSEERFCDSLPQGQAVCQQNECVIFGL